MNGRGRLVLGLVILVTLNLLAVVALRWTAERSPGSQLAGQAAAGVLFGQVLILGFWLALGDVKWYWRLALAVPATLLVSQSIGWTSALTRGTRAADDNGAGFATLMFLVMLLLSYILLWPLRRLRGWRLTWQHETASQSATHQFHSGDLLLWMIPIGGALASFRFLVSVNERGSDGLAEFLFSLLGLLVLVGFAMVTAFATRHSFHRIAALLGLVLLIGSPFAGHEVYGWLSARGFFATPVARPWQVVVSVGLWKAIEVLLPFLMATLISLIDFLALRWLGCRLLRPGAAHASSVDSR